MLKKFLALMIAILLIHSMILTQSVSADARPDEQARLAEKARVGVAKLGTGTQSIVEVKLRDKTKLTGYISESNEDRFVITNAKTGASVAVAYADVAKIKGQNLSTGAKIGIGITVGFLVTALIIYIIVNNH